MKTTVVNIKYKKANVFIGRPSKWGNPFVIGRDGTREEVIEKYKQWIKNQPDLLRLAPIELKGNKLGCFCKPLACHGDILAKIADE